MCDECSSGWDDTFYVCEYICDTNIHHIEQDDNDGENKDCYKLETSKRHLDVDDNDFDLIYPASFGKYGIFYDCMCKPEGFNYCSLHNHNCDPIDSHHSSESTTTTKTTTTTTTTLSNHSNGDDDDNDGHDSLFHNSQENDRDDDDDNDSLSNASSSSSNSTYHYYNGGADDDDTNDEEISLVILVIGLLIFLCCASILVYGLWYCTKPDDEEYPDHSVNQTLVSSVVTSGGTIVTSPKFWTGKTE